MGDAGGEVDGGEIVAGVKEGLKMVLGNVQVLGQVTQVLKAAIPQNLATLLSYAKLLSMDIWARLARTPCTPCWT